MLLLCLYMFWRVYLLCTERPYITFSLVFLCESFAYHYSFAIKSVAIKEAVP